MPSSFRLQIRKQIQAAGDESLGTYVFRDVELPFVPLPGLKVQDFDGQEYTITQNLVWREGQHRFICYDVPHREDDGSARSVEEVVADYEQHGWKRNQRAAERLRA